MNIANQLNEILKEYNFGNKNIAYTKFKKFFLKNKENTKLRYNLAVMQSELNLISEAKKNYKFLIINYAHLKSKINLYNIYLKEENFLKALSLINEVLKEDPSNNLTKIDKAFVLYKLNQFKDSIEECKLILSIKNYAQALNIWGLCCLALKNYEEANSLFLKALKLDKDNIIYLNSIGRLKHEIRESKLAEKYFLKALSLNPKTFQTLNNLAGFYLEEGQYTKAVNFYKESLSLNPKNNIILNNLAKAYLSLDKIDTAEKFALKALYNEANNDDFKKTLSLILLTKYDFKNAWKYFDGRLSISSFSSVNNSYNLVKKKLLIKSDINKNSKLLVIREQGVGDEILYASMYPDLLNKFDNVKIECDPRLVKIYENSFGHKHAHKFLKLGNISENEEKLKHFDYIMYAGSLGKFFRNDIESFPSKPFFKKIDNYKDPELDKILKDSNKIKIGLSWKSFKNRYAKEKSLELEDFNNFFKLENCSFFNLQYGDIEEELNNFIKEKSVAITTLKNLDLFNNLIGLANLLSNLDFLITVSNSTAHLAGALGVKTLLIKPVNHASYHYWNFPTNQTPWYQSIKMINKKELNNYDFIKKYILN